MSTWESVPFDWFNRQSRVTYNVQTELEDMLAKLDRPQGGFTEQEETKRLLKNRRKRKFLELSVPVVIVSLLCLAWSMIYLVETGSSIVNNRQVNSYFSELQALDECVKALVNELSAREDLADSDDFNKDLKDVYDTTNKALFKIAPGRTKKEWQITEKIDKYRNNPIKEKTFIGDGNFYSLFIQEVLDFGLSSVKHIEELPMWKKNHEYCKLSKQIYSIRTTLILMRYICSVTASKRHSNLSATEFAYFRNSAELSLNKMKLNDSAETSQFLRNSKGIFGNISINFPNNSLFNNDFMLSENEKSCNATLAKLNDLYLYKQKRREMIFIFLIENNSLSLKENIIMFCCVLVTVFFTVACIVIFGYLLRYQCLVSVAVSDWLEKIMTEVKEQELYRQLLIKRVCPKGLRDELDLSTWIKMIPYYIPEATMAMISIAHFNSFFHQFTASQTVQILSFVMDLLDERMEQYSVFPVAKSGDEQIIISDTINRRDDEQHACVIANMALDMTSCCNDVEVGSGGGSKLQLKIGIHTGPCIGMLYIRKGEICFKLTGNSVRILHKLHRLCLPNRIQVTDNTHRLLSKSETYSLHCRGHMEVKGVSQHKIYWLNGRKVSVSAFQDCESHFSRVGSWFELEKKPLYRLDEDEGGYTPLDKSYRPRNFSITSHMTMESFRFNGSQDAISD